MGQRTHYLDDDGNPGGVKNRTDALTVAIAWAKSTRRIACAWAVAITAHESNRTLNQQDDDTRDDGNGGEIVVHRTGGIFQLDIVSLSPLQKGDAVAAFGPIIGATKSVYDLQDACDIMAALCERRLDWLESQFPDMDSASQRFWLAVGHNLGTGTMKKSATKHKGDAEEFLNDPDNASLGIVAHGYGRDAMTGGPDYLPSMEPDTFDPTGADAPSVSASAKSTASWLLLLFVLLAAYYFLYARGRGKVIPSWLVNF